MPRFYFGDFDKFREKAESLGIHEDLSELRTLGASFFRNYSKYAILVLVLPRYNFITIFKDNLSISYPFLPAIDNKWLNEIKKRRNSENTLIAYYALDQALDEYEKEYLKAKEQIHKYEESYNFEMYEELSRSLRDLTDVVESFLRTCFRIDRSKSKFISIDLIEYDFDVLIEDARYLLDRIISTKKEINFMRNKFELEISKELNINVAKLTEIMLILTIISLIISVPNTVATIFGVAPLAQLVTPDFIIGLTLFSTVLAVIVSVWYIKYNRSSSSLK